MRSKRNQRRPVPVVAFADDDDPHDTEEHRRYLALMAQYPNCACGQSPWAPVSIARGFCEACRMAQDALAAAEGSP